MGFGGNRRGGMGMRGGRGRMMPNDMRERGQTPGSHYISGTGHSVHMRGLPFQAIEQDIADVRMLGFFGFVFLKLLVQDSIP